jgi:hypothetical protein
MYRDHLLWQVVCESKTVLLPQTTFKSGVLSNFLSSSPCGGLIGFMAQHETPAAAEDKKAAAVAKLVTLLRQVSDDAFAAGSNCPFWGVEPTFVSEKAEIEAILEELCS